MDSRVLLSLTLCLMVGCGSSQEHSETAEAPALSVEEAQRIVDEERAKRQMSQVPRPPQSPTEVIDILQHDESDRFASTRDYLMTMDTIDALITRAQLELLWTEGNLTVAALAKERAHQKKSESDLLTEQLKLTPNDAALTARLEAAGQDVQREHRLWDALQTLAKVHSDLAEGLAREVVRRDPERADGYGLLANVYRLHEDWPEYQRNLELAEARSAERFGVSYARATERVERLGDRDGARAALVALRTEHPEMARIQAQLVLLQDDVKGRYTELEKLKAINPRHALVVLEGAGIEREYQLANELHPTAAAPAKPAAPAAPATTP
jgi:hypothetical protein